ncbi:hypothetical protein HUO13_26180 [Saccharopolyspora erythraea]|uniref:hypothetical protein n=1 Tax=Saccharopolyspora erythraea TaxID=1836 RepID=UPI001BA4E418|nr:hypothetical protein [Saccharopolyspora erythraea]QUH03839.1 hypothetical protein HUO13_26180 [Saccharopolyspora erythraea]
MIIYSAEVQEAEGRYTLTITDHRLSTTQSAEVPPHMVDQIPMVLQMLRMVG